VVALIGATIFGVQLVDAAQRRLLLIGAGLLPVIGFLLDFFKGRSFADVLWFASAFAMAYAVGLMTGKVKKP
jgi:hypothetical protein